MVALGGNALGLTPGEQLASLRAAAPGLVDMAEASQGLVVTHGNGPQVGQIDRAWALGSAVDPSVPALGLPEMVAMSQGYIGDHVVGALSQEVARRGREPQVSAVVTRVRVSPSDPSFAHPTKPIGPFLTEEMARRRMAEHPEHVYGPDAGRGFRRMVASPSPVEILEIDAVRALVAAGFITVACGGGGIPVVSEGETGALRAVDAVIDKDSASALLASDLGADTLVILTAVHRVAVGWGTPQRTWLSSLSVDRGRELCALGEFAAGSMGPKVQAAVDFVAGGGAVPRRAVICSLADASRALSGEVGTTIHP